MKTEVRNIGIAVAVAACMLLVAWFLGERAQAEKQAGEHSAAKLSFDLRGQKDSDNDGVPDWKELLVGTDPNNEDSDGDGVLDGKEEASDSEFRPITVETANLAPIDRLARKFLAGYVNASAQGKSPEALANELVAEEVVLPDYHIYAVGELAAPRPAGEAQTYWNELLSAIQKLFSVPDSELAVFARAVENQDTSELHKLATAREIYAEALKNIVAIRPVSGGTEIHLELLNALSFLNATVALMEVSTGDPVEALTAIKSYNEAEERLEKAFSRLNTFLLGNGVTQ